MSELKKPRRATLSVPGNRHLQFVRMEGWVGNWRVSNEPSLSDHRYIQFKWKEKWSETRAFRENLRNKLQSLNQALEQRMSLITGHFSERSCLWTIPKGTWGTPWWNRELEDLRRETGRTFNRAKNTRNSVDWRIDREAKKLYKNRINVVWLEAIRLPTGEYTISEEECLKLLLKANFPGFRLSHEMGDKSSGRNRQQRAALDLAAKVVTPEKVNWAIRNFQPFKTPGIDEIYPAILQDGL
ncbi:hypothetical protein TSAR_007651 [Trichomalopsis sarcophagae]|uniref:Endonuclease/exonuclease/phosphatase domain-containing protein n=1 Tax=Trichomalopsis sarcophagae TaxID=543379 RepID=A0A232ED84_9HYME|nr:hypothetical protein TSAR_007651 [Trichomalopsis sarcophagae]